MAEGRDGERVATQRAAALSLLGESELAHHARETSRAHAQAGAGILQDRTLVRRQARLLSFSIAAELQIHALAFAQHRHPTRSAIALRGRVPPQIVVAKIGLSRAGKTWTDLLLNQRAAFAR